MPSTILATEGAIGALKTGIKGIASTTLSSPISQFSLLTLTKIRTSFTLRGIIDASFPNVELLLDMFFSSLSLFKL